ncbi:hypothetical protein HYALB_00005435 [Hymenoscyphus albidus]|uniref:NADP-dependent oxidoreductase domain-containing protein n=1 Tax=Hymenoscyphus albidus TaxID=595503 RepID=A0A9N9LAA2_9HELO|nr:hypothetical protein HYALB_00005435 [Hymenoscyphus albidus]
MSQPKAIFGAALLGMSFNDVNAVDDVLDTLSRYGANHIDTAPRYPPFERGTSERLLGNANAEAKGFSIDSKVLATPGGAGELEPENVKISISDTLARLKSTQLGVVGFQPDQLQDFLEVARINNRIRPTVYQGEYNNLTRGMEEKILPLLRAQGISYYAHCPLAAGFLTGNFTHGKYAGTRYATDHPLHHVFHERYDNEALHQALLEIENAGVEHGIPVHEVALRWIFHHSSLEKEDGVITGCTNLQQIKENGELIRRGPLPEDVVEIVGKVWRSLKAERGELL